MANIEIEVAARKYVVACRDGEEDHLRSVAALVDARARDAAAALGSMSEARHLLFAALLLADDLASAGAGPDLGVRDAVEGLAARMEALADRLEERPADA